MSHLKVFIFQTMFMRRTKEIIPTNFRQVLGIRHLSKMQYKSKSERVEEQQKV